VESLAAEHRQNWLHLQEKQARET
jgi:hypothetical protein